MSKVSAKISSLRRPKFAGFEERHDYFYEGKASDNEKNKEIQDRLLNDGSFLPAVFSVYRIACCDIHGT
jgi:hypothetical protein